MFLNEPDNLDGEFHVEGDCIANLTTLSLVYSRYHGSFNFGRTLGYERYESARMGYLGQH